MRYFSVTHTHEYGVDTKLVKCEGDFLAAFRNTDESDMNVFMVNHTGLNVELDKGEEVFVDEIDLDSVLLVEL